MLSIHEIGGWNPVKVLRIDTQNAGPRFVEISDDMRRAARRISQHRTDEDIAEDKHNLRNLLRTQLDHKVFQPDYDSSDLIDDFELDGFVHAFVELLHPGTFDELSDAL